MKCEGVRSRVLLELWMLPETLFSRDNDSHGHPENTENTQVYTSRCSTELKVVLSTSTQPSNSLHTLLPSDKRYKSIHCTTDYRVAPFLRTLNTSSSFHLKKCFSVQLMSAISLIIQTQGSPWGSLFHVT